MRLSARNQLKGTVTKVTKGATTSHVVVDNRQWPDDHLVHHK